MKLSFSPLLLLLGCATAPGYPSDVQIGAYEATNLACVDQYATRAEIDQCRARARATFCASWPTTTYCEAVALHDGGAP